MTKTENTAPPPAAFPSADQVRNGLLGVGSSNGSDTYTGVSVDGPPLRADMEESLREVMYADRYDGQGNGPVAWLKKLIIRLGRPITRRQTAFNERTIAALKEVGNRSILVDRQLNDLSLKIRKQTLETQAELVAMKSELVNETFQLIREHLDSIHNDLKGHHTELQSYLDHQVIPKLSQSVAEQHKLIDDKMAALLAEESAAMKSLLQQISLPQASQDNTEAASFAPAPSSETTAASPNKLKDDLDYYHFELKMRGDPGSIRKRQEGYRDLLAEKLGDLKEKAILDVGGGSGIFVELLQETGAAAESIDLNAVAVGAGREMGRSVRVASLHDDLAAREENSLHAITAFQVVEHLPEAELKNFLEQAHRVLQSGGLILLETLNPRSIAAYRWYFMDLTHAHFLQPETLEHLAQNAGFQDNEIHETSQPPDWERLREDVGDEAMQENIKRLNAFLYGPMEYYLLGYKR